MCCKPEIAQENDAPYAWRSALGSKQDQDKATLLPDLRIDFWGAGVSRNVRNFDFQSSLQVLKDNAIANGIAFRLPKTKAVAGGVLQHSLQVLEGLFAKYDPMIFKVGFCHDPSWRWNNKLYGYAHSLDKWSNMTVFFASPDHMVLQCWKQLS